jgi:magnesium-transporting ATPase (P-type)
MLLNVFRSSSIKTIESFDLVVGDVVVLDVNFLRFRAQIPCDMILIQGEAVVDESSLTGETIPVVKVPLPSSDDILNCERQKINILFGGSRMKQIQDVDGQVVSAEVRKSVVENYVNTNVKIEKCALAIVYSTGFGTSKGQLFRSILFPTEIVILD